VGYLSDPVAGAGDHQAARQTITGTVPNRSDATMDGQGTMNTSHRSEVTALDQGRTALTLENCHLAHGEIASSNGIFEAG